MQYWQGGALPNLLFLCALLFIAAAVRRAVPLVSRWAIPDSVIAGGLGFVLGTSVLDVVPFFNPKILETVVYHGLAVLFITVGLQAPVKGAKSGEARSIAMGIPVLALVQGIVGLGVVLLWAGSANPLHPGFGLMLPLGFSQGPGQALSLGKSWESAGFVDGGQLGLIMAALGFAWCVVVGVPLVAYARWKGWITPPERAHAIGAGEIRTEPPEPPPGGQEPLAVQIAAVGAVYLVTFGVLTLLADAAEGKTKIQDLIWSFHFIIASVIAVLSRKVLVLAKMESRLNDALLGRVAGLVVDVTTTAALAAVALPVLMAYGLPILIMTTLGGTVTLLGSLWIAKRAFPQAPFEHALVLFGTSTGTLPTGLTLLRILDPDLKGPVATSTVLGASLAVLPGAPALLVIMPYAVYQWNTRFPAAVWENIGMHLIYLVILMVVWRLVAPLRFLRPFTAMWPERKS